MAYRVTITREGRNHEIRVLTQDDVYELTRLMPDGYAEAVTVDEVHVTKTGKVLTDTDIHTLADEAERGYEQGPDGKFRPIPE